MRRSRTSHTTFTGHSTTCSISIIRPVSASCRRSRPSTIGQTNRPADGPYFTQDCPNTQVMGLLDFFRRRPDRPDAPSSQGASADVSGAPDLAARSVEPAVEIPAGPPSWTLLPTIRTVASPTMHRTFDTDIGRRLRAQRTAGELFASSSLGHTIDPASIGTVTGIAAASDASSGTAAFSSGPDRVLRRRVLRVADLASADQAHPRWPALGRSFDSVAQERDQAAPDVSASLGDSPSMASEPSGESGRQPSAESPPDATFASDDWATRAGEPRTADSRNDDHRSLPVVAVRSTPPNGSVTRAADPFGSAGSVGAFAPTVRRVAASPEPSAVASSADPTAPGTAEPASTPTLGTNALASSEMGAPLFPAAHPPATQSNVPTTQSNVAASPTQALLRRRSIVEIPAVPPAGVAHGDHHAPSGVAQRDLGSPFAASSGATSDGGATPDVAQAMIPGERSAAESTAGPAPREAGPTTNATLGHRPGLGAPLASLPSTAISRFGDDSRDWVASWNDPPEFAGSEALSGGRPAGGPNGSSDTAAKPGAESQGVLAPLGRSVVSRVQAAEGVSAGPVLSVVSGFAAGEPIPPRAFGDLGLDPNGSPIPRVPEVGDRPLVGGRAMSISVDGSFLPDSTDGYGASSSGSAPVPLLRTFDGPTSAQRPGSAPGFRAASAASPGNPTSVPRATISTSAPTAPNVPISRRFDSASSPSARATGALTPAGPDHHASRSAFPSLPAGFGAAEPTDHTGPSQPHSSDADRTPAGSELRTVPTMIGAAAVGTTFEAVAGPSAATLRRQASSPESSAQWTAAWDERSNVTAGAAGGPMNAGSDVAQRAYQNDSTTMPASVQRESDADADAGTGGGATVPAASTDASPAPVGHPAAGSTAQAEADIEALAGRLYERLRSRLRRELLDDRERAGLVLDRLR